MNEVAEELAGKWYLTNLPMRTYHSERGRNEMSLLDANELLGGLHDATFVAMEFRWHEATVLLTLEDQKGARRVLIEEVTQLQCTRKLPWGKSKYINEARATAATSSADLEVHIEMQSGDVLEIWGKRVREKI